MKNIHLLPTEKPSRLYLGDNGNFVFGMMQTSIQSRNDDFTNQNIYITNDEEIEEGDYGYNLISSTIDRFTKSLLSNKKYYKKIILTTDMDLIKDGVQAIDNEFLEWFVKNPSCESVETYSLGVRNQLTGESGHYKYEIIIPQEEPKQETLEEFIKSQPYYGYCTTEYTEGIEVGAKWQQERMYSEEEVIELLRKYRYDLSSGKTPNIGDTTKCWFEKFKKK